jgi:predicted permease
MNPLPSIRSSFAFFFQRSRLERDMDDELRSHIEIRADDLERSGIARARAERQARVEFGAYENTKEECRDAFLSRAITELIADVRFGARMLLRNFGVAAVAVASLALGIGANVTIFSYVNALLLRAPSGVSSPARLLGVWNKIPNSDPPYLQQNYPDYAFYRRHNTVFSDLVAFSSDPIYVAWSRTGSTQLIWGQLVSSNYFSGLGVAPVLGRAFAPGEDGVGRKEPVVVLSHAFWQRQFGSSPGAIGREVTLNGHRFTIAGIAPADFSGIETGFAPDFWTPITMQREIVPGDDWLSSRGTAWLYEVGRLKRTVTGTQAQAELNVLAKRNSLAHPSDRTGWRTSVTPLNGVYDPDFRQYVRPFSFLLMVLVGFVLAIACANSANLRLAQAWDRSREMAIRTALGASRGRLVRMVLVETVLLALIAGAAGLVLAMFAARLMLRLKPPMLSFVNIALPSDWRVIGFTVLVSLVTGMLFGLAPALRGSKVEVMGTLKEETIGSLRKSRWRSALVVAQIAVCIVLLTGAMLCLRSLWSAQSINPGFQTKGRLEISLDLNTLGYPRDRVDRFYGQLPERVAAVPGVRAAGLISYLPLGFNRTAVGIAIVGRPTVAGKNAPSVGMAAASPGYFEAMGIPLLRGRAFNAGDTAKSPQVTVINEEMARRFWPGMNPVGRTIVFPPDLQHAFQIVGVVATGKYASLRESPAPFMYLALSQFYDPRAVLVASTESDPGRMIQSVEQVIHKLDADVPVTDAETLDRYMSVPLFNARVSGTMLGAVGALALLLAMIGLFGLVAYYVSQRTREFGIRVAMGAQRTDVLKLAVSKGMNLVFIGVSIGLVCALALSRFLSALLFGVKPADAVTFMTVPVVMTVVALLACYIPARRASRVDPMTALRHE